MINSVSQSASAAIEASKLREGSKTAGKPTVSGGSTASAVSEQTPSPMARMAAQGAPVDVSRVAEIRAAIASGNYPVDPQKIAAKMLALDIPATDA